MRSRLDLGLAVLMVLAALCLPSPTSAQNKPTVRIGIVSDGPETLDLGVHQLLQKEIIALTGDEFDIVFPASKSIVADWTIAGVRSAVDQLLADPDVDLLLAGGVFASHEVGHRTQLSKPVVAPFIVDPAVQGLPFDAGASGVHNLSYVNYPHDFGRDFRAFREIVPFEKMAFLANALYWEAMPELPGAIEAIAKASGIDITMVPVGVTAAGALAAIPADIEAVYLVPLTRFTDAEFSLLVDGLIERKLPTFSLFGRTDVEKGVLAALAPKADFERLARRVAVNIQRILLGEDAGTLPSTLESGERPSINMATARAIGVYPSWAILTEAELVDETRRNVERHLNLAQAMTEGIAVNLDYMAAGRAVESSREDVHEAISGLLPQLSVSTTGTLIDEDRAAASLGAQAERTLSGSANLNQIVFSEPAWANWNVQTHLLEATRRRHDQVRLDVAHDAGSAYVNVLRSKTFERIQKDNLALTRSNLERATVRLQTGVANRSEVLRWESEIAQGRLEVIKANSRRNQAEIALNRVLHRPLEEPFTTEEASVDDVSLPTRDPRFLSYFQNPWNFRVFRAFVVEEGLKTSPQLSELDALIDAQQRALTSSRLAYWMPTLALQGAVTERWAREGAGSSAPALPGGLAFPRADDRDWSLALRASIPLFSGGAKWAAAERAREDLERLRVQRQAAAERVEQGIRSALHEAGATFAGIQLARDAAAAAQSGLELVTDAYSRGQISIIDLLDAQNTALVANLGAANAVYDFLLDLMDVQHAIGTFDYSVDAAAREAWFERAEAYMDRARAER